LILAVNGYHSLWAYRRALKLQGMVSLRALCRKFATLLFANGFRKGGKTLGTWVSQN
jgi:hypothetical protein